MRHLPKIQFDDEFKQAVSDHLNQNTMLMNPRTGTVQSIDLWQVEKDSKHPEQFIQRELVEVKLVDNTWVKVN